MHGAIAVAEASKGKYTNKTQLMNAIEEVDSQSRTLTAQSGAIVETLIDCAAEHDLLLPLNFGAKGSAQIGGAIATNACGGVSLNSNSATLTINLFPNTDLEQSVQCF